MLRHDLLEEKTLQEYSPVVLAYIGDAVFELVVRTRLVSAGNRRIKDLHNDAIERVRAGSQARAIRLIYDELNSEEQNVVKRGRNAKTTPPRNADPGDYKMSTGFEALLGYLYLKGEEDRLYYIINRALLSLP